MYQQNQMDVPGSQKIKEGLHTLREKAEDVSHQGSAYIRDEYDNLKKTGMQKMHSAEDQIKRHPKQSVALGVAAGLALAYFLNKAR